MNDGIEIPATIRAILELARWAPSGDNEQCWRFEVLSASHLVVHGFRTPSPNFYDLTGHSSQIAIGSLLETIVVAATTQSLRTEISRRTVGEKDHLTFDVHFLPATDVEPDPLVAAITSRSVQRRSMSTRALTAHEKNVLEAAVAPEFSITWAEDFSSRLGFARLMFQNGKLRLTMREAYEVHRRVIHWGARFSCDRIPDRAIGADPITVNLMKWAMANWRRLSWMNAIFGTWLPRLQMELLPGVACAAHYILKARSKPITIDDRVRIGRAVQRFWLTLTDLGLVMQPETTPLIFASYLDEGVEFTQDEDARANALRLHAKITALIYTDASFPVYMGRLGAGPAARSRSLRLSVEQLLIPPGAE